MIVRGQIVDIENRKIFSGALTVENGTIKKIETENHSEKQHILPGFVDAHIHTESSMLVPSEFAKVAVCHGTIATVSDPHEIANVLGVKGVEFMIENGKQTPFKFNFGAPSCVPATNFESAGAVIDSEGIKTLLQNPDIKYLAEMMNYPGVIFDDEEVHKKIAWANHFNKPVDGHAPGLRGEDLSKYIAAGISTDHECFTYNEALEKLQKGMKVIVREGSAAKNFEALIDLLPEHFENMMFCSDDKHPDDLLLGHINQLCGRAVAKGMDVFKVLQMACVNPVKHYNLDVGLLQVGDAADFIVVEDLISFHVLSTYINGELVFNNGKSFVKHVNFERHNNFNTDFKQVPDFKMKASSNHVRVIEALDGQLVTNEIYAEALVYNGNLISNTDKDILKMTVVNRYQNEIPAMAFIKNFGLKQGAIASSVAHDCHNILAVGINDELICKAVNAIIKTKGGIAVVTEETEEVMALPIAGIMSDLDAKTVGKTYEALSNKAKSLGSTLHAPFMTLSFMALLVIPKLKLSDQGLFDGEKFEFTSINVL
jgi:adenine deaminase